MDPAQPRRAHPETARDLAVQRATKLTKWAGVGALAMTGALAGFVAQAKPGHSVNTNTAAGGSGRSGVTSSAGSTRPSGSAAGSGGGSATSLNPPPAPPVPAPAPSPPTVVSGGS